ncbi:hypothetical protein MTO96_009811 [Rhipicephalus appendiculatus]
MKKGGEMAAVRGPKTMALVREDAILKRFTSLHHHLSFSRCLRRANSGPTNCRGTGVVRETRDMVFSGVRSWAGKKEIFSRASDGVDPCAVDAGFRKHALPDTGETFY